MKSNQKFSQSKQTSLEGLQSVALKQQDLPLTLTVHLRGNTKLGETGQKHIKNCTHCGVTLKEGVNWQSSQVKQKKYWCNTCKQKSNERRMWVNGKYISFNHPLYKPGRYKGFTDAAFSSLQNYEDSKQGQVYVIRNPAFPSWCKVGMAIDAEDRLKQYQTSSPYRDYVLVAAWDVEDRREAEKQAHALLEQHYDRRGEWFVAFSDMAAERLEELFNKDSDNE